MTGFLAATLFLARLAVTHAVRVVPPNPTTHTSIDVTAVGSWPDACPVSAGAVSISGSTITLHLASGAICPALVTPYTTTFHLDLLPAGTYTVVTVDDRLARELATTTLIVRDADPFALVPYGVPVTGGKVSIAAANAPVTIDGVAAPAAFLNGVLTVDAPPHAAGAADVKIGSVTAKSALIYYDPAAADPAVFEPILFPVSFQGPGAAGSQWTTENVVELGAQSFFRDAVASGPLANDVRPWGRVLYAVRGTIDDATFDSRVRDLSRQAQSAGTEVPVVRERDFRPRRLRFLNVPYDGRSRVMLRVWSLDDTAVAFGLGDTRDIVPSIQMTRIEGTAMWFGSVDITSRLSTGVQNAIADTSSSVPRLWGMISITNNDTQQVTLVTPQ